MPSKNNIKNKAQLSHNKHTFGAERGCQKKKKRRAQKQQEAERAEKKEEKGGTRQGPLGDGDLNVLLLGEGDFSFAAALALEWGACDKGDKLTASGLSSESAALKTEGTDDNIETIKAFGGLVLHRVDATALHACDALQQTKKKGRHFDRIVFNFPCSSAGGHKARPADLVIADQQALLRGCFKSVLSGKLLATLGQIHITLRPADASKWDLVTLAKLAGLRVHSCGPFDASKYQGYVSPHLDTPAVTYALVVASPPAAKLEAEAKSAKIAAVAKAHPELRLGPTGQTFNEAWQARHKKGLPSSRQSTHPR